MRVALILLFTIVSLRDGWQSAVTDPRATPPGDDAAWSEEFEIVRGRELWFRNRLPERIPEDAQLVFRSYLGQFELFVDQQRIYVFDQNDAHGQMSVHTVALPAHSEGRRIFVLIPHPDDVPMLATPLLVSRAELPAAIRRVGLHPLRDNLGDIAAGAFLFVLGLISIAVSQLLRRGDTRTLLYFGLMATLYGARLLIDSYLPYVLGMRVRETSYAIAWLTYIINIPGWALARQLIGEGWRSSLRWQLLAFAIFAPIAIAADVVTGRAGSLEQANNVLVIVGGVNILFNLLRSGRWRSIELRVILAGALIFLAFAIANNLSSLGILPWDDIDETLGFVAFVIALGYAATRSFLRGEQARVALEGELATAREIQRSILPTSMPQIAGLRFHAHYDPASSVAGDLYDFLIIDERRVGAIVADVSGHGVPAALIASMVKIAVTSQSRFAHEPASLLREVSRTLRGEVRRGFVTAIYLYFDSARACVEIANAGHPPPLLHRGNEVREIGPRGVVLGRFDGTYAAESIALQPGDRIIAYTDGVIEARNARGEAFGEERLHEIIRKGADPGEIARQVRAWRDEKSEADDVTLVGVDVVLVGS